MLKRFTSNGNPFFRGMNNSINNGYANSPDAATLVTDGTMTRQGAINKTFMLFGILLVTAIWGWQAPNPVFLIGGSILGLVLVLIGVFKREWSPVIAPAYAAVEGLVVGSVSAIYAGFGGGIVIQAISLTLLILFIMLVIQKTGIIPVTNQFRIGVAMATGGIALLYLLTWILSMFHINIPYIHQGGTIGILFSLGVIGIASLNLLIDFDNMVKGEQYGFPKYMEWFTAMGLMITLIWLYFEILRLLSKLRD